MQDLPRIVGVCSQFPSEYVEQSSITHALSDKWRDADAALEMIEKLHRSSRVKSRHIAMPIEYYETTRSFADRNNVYVTVGLDIAEKAITKLLESEHVTPQEISQIIFTTVTGLAIPSIEARLMNKIPFSPHLKRVPMFGLGCVAGAAGISRAFDYLKGHPDDLVILLALELCSLTFQEDDMSMANMVSSGLFGDGCAAVLIAGGKRAQALKSGPRIVDSCSYFFPDSERVMGFDISDKGFKIVLSSEVPRIAEEKLPPCVDHMLARHHVHRSDISAWIAHPGGPKVLEALSKGLALPPDALSYSYESLSEVGNLSSASVLLVLEKTLAGKNFRPGDYAVLLAMGPAFCAEVVLLRW